MKTGKSNLFLVVVLGIIVAGAIYTACKDIVPEQERVETPVEVKFSK